LAKGSDLQDLCNTVKFVGILANSMEQTKEEYLLDFHDRLHKSGVNVLEFGSEWVKHNNVQHS
jgi:ABC-type uncharacterized transport system substrate-binding protein